MAAMPGRVARDVARDLSTGGLQVEIDDVSRISYIPVDRTTGHALLIEDELEAAKVAESMIAAGVPVTHIED